jgi:hypothetical protein
MSSPHSEEYDLHKVPLKDLTDQIDDIWKQLQNPDSAEYELAIRNGIDEAVLADLKNYSRDEALKLKHGKGLDPATVALIVAFAPVAAKITKDVWDNFILGRLQKRFGAKAIKRKTRK